MLVGSLNFYSSDWFAVLKLIEAWDLLWNEIAADNENNIIARDRGNEDRNKPGDQGLHINTK
jgi:hypothetical protein